MQFTITQPAGPGETFASGAVDGWVGKSVTMNYFGEKHPATIIAARVADDGSATEFTLELPDGALPDIQPKRNRWSIGFRTKRATP